MKITTLLPVLLVLGASVSAHPAALQEKPVDRFVQHVDKEWPGESRQQALTRDSLQLLVTAVEDLARRRQTDSEFGRDVQDVRDATAKYAAGVPGELSQSRQLRRTLEAAADVIRDLSMQTPQGRTIEPRLNALRRSAESLDPEQPLRRQPDVLERFFHHAAEVLKALDTR